MNRFKNYLKILAVPVLCMCIALTTLNAWATEGGSGVYPNGAEGVMAGAVPPPGFYYLNYITHYTADRLKDKDSNKVPVDFHLNATANVFRFVYVTNYQLLGANYGVHMIVPLVHVSASLNGTPAGALSSTESGLGDMSFRRKPAGAPCQAWRAEKSHQVIASTAGCEYSSV